MDFAVCCVTLEHLTVLSLDLVFIYVVNIRCSEISNVLFDRFLTLQLAWHLEIMSVGPVNFP